MGMDPERVSSVEIVARAGSDLDSPLRITFEVMVYDEAILSLITEDLEPLDDTTDDKPPFTVRDLPFTPDA